MRKFGQALKRAIWRPENVALLDHHEHGTWVCGGCLMLARAVSRMVPGARIASLTSDGKHIGHAVVRVGDWVLDGDGASTPKEFEKRWRDLEGVQGKIGLEDVPPEHAWDSAIPDDPASTETLYQNLRSSLGVKLGKSQREKDLVRVASVAPLRDGKLLFGKRNDNGKWTLPGGHLNPGEKPVKGALRELLEETGLKPVEVRYLGSARVPGKNMTVYSYEADIDHSKEPSGDNDPDGECSEFRWVKRDTVPDEIMDHLHSPRNVTLQLMGCQEADLDLKPADYEDVDEFGLEKVILDPNAGYRFEHTVEPVPDDEVFWHRGPEDLFHVKAFDAQGNQVGEATARRFLDPTHQDRNSGKKCLESEWVHVHPDHRRKGLASAMYARLEGQAHCRFIPSSSQSELGQALWQGNVKQKQFGKSESRSELTAEEYLHQLKAKVEARSDLKWTKKATLHYGKDYDFVQVASREDHASVMLIRAGFHGEEIAGPMTVLDHLDEIADLAAERHLGLLIYPLANPSGFEGGTRWNEDHKPKKGDDFVRYADDNYQGSQRASGPGADANVEWKFTLDADPHAELSQEVAAMTKEVLPWDSIRIFVDLHQECWLPKSKSGPSSYAYVFGDKNRYLPIVKQVRDLVPIYTDESSADEPADKNGLIISHDGSFADAADRHGVEHSIVVETTGETPLKTAELVNLLWIEGVMKMVAEKPLAKMALKSFAPGSKLPSGTEADTSKWDYSHILTPEHRAAGYRLEVHDCHVVPKNMEPYTNLTAYLLHPTGKHDQAHQDGQVGVAEGAIYSEFAPKGMRKYADCSLAEIDGAKGPDGKFLHRGRGLGLALFEAFHRHAMLLGATRAKGGEHSTSASGTLEAMSRKHKLKYRAFDGPEEEDDGVRYDANGLAYPPLGSDFDGAYSGYDFALKTELTKGALVMEKKKSQVWRSKDGISIPVNGSPDREEWDKRFFAALVQAFARGDPTRLRLVQLAPDAMSGSNMAVNKDRLALYRRMARQDKLPPVVVRRSGQGYHMLDGNHRQVAAQEAKLPTMDAYEIVEPVLKLLPEEGKAKEALKQKQAKKVKVAKSEGDLITDWVGSIKDTPEGSWVLPLAKATLPEQFKGIVKASDCRGASTVDHKAQVQAHPPQLAPAVEHYQEQILDSPRVYRKKPAAGNGISSKMVFETKVDAPEPSKPKLVWQGDLFQDKTGGRVNEPPSRMAGKFMVKPYHEKIVRAVTSWQRFLIQGWAEMTNQALFHAAGIGHLHQAVHVAEHDMGTGRPEPALVVHMDPDFCTLMERVQKGSLLTAQFQAAQIGLMDFLGNNLDRHFGNILVHRTDPKLLAIDHSRNFQYCNNHEFKWRKRAEMNSLFPRQQAMYDHFGHYLMGLGRTALNDLIDNPFQHAGGRAVTAAGRVQAQTAFLYGIGQPLMDWWKTASGPVRSTMYAQLEAIKDPAVKAHVRRNFDARADWLDERTRFSLDNYSLDWYDDAADQYLPHQKTDEEIAEERRLAAQGA